MNKYMNLRNRLSVLGYTKAAALLCSWVDAPIHEYWLKASPETLAALYTQAELVVIPSQIPESFSYVAAEARAYGCRILASQQGGIAEALSGYESATFLPVGFNQECLNRSVTEALKKPKSAPTSSDVAEWAQRHNWIYEKERADFMSRETSSKPAVHASGVAPYCPPE